MEKKFLNMDDVSTQLCLSKSTLYSYVHTKNVPYIKLGGKLLFNQTDLDTWINSQKKNTVPKQIINKEVIK
jgi:excisionase family DNA binding protein